jgi:hypothetical protein
LCLMIMPGRICVAGIAIKKLLASGYWEVRSETRWAHGPVAERPCR